MTLKVSDLSARVSRGFALAGITFLVEPGKVLAVLGPNGSGKSTLLRLIAGLAAPTGGELQWVEPPEVEALSAAGRVLVPPERRGVCLLMQQGVLFPHLSVRENVALGVPPDRPDEETARLVGEALAAARVAHLADARPGRLSGGEAQRVALARALAQRPRVMLLDEPFHSLDATVKRAVLADLRRLVTERGLAAVLVTHDVEEAEALADEVYLLRRGRGVAQGDLDTLYRRPRDLWTARFLGEVGAIDAADAAAAGVLLPDGAAGTVHFRPEAVQVEEAPDGLAVIAARPGRTFTELTLALPGGARLVSRSAGHLPLHTASRARARITWALPANLSGDPAS